MARDKGVPVIKLVLGEGARCSRATGTAAEPWRRICSALFEAMKTKPKSVTYYPEQPPWRTFTYYPEAVELKGTLKWGVRGKPYLSRGGGGNKQ